MRPLPRPFLFILIPFCLGIAASRAFAGTVKLPLILPLALGAILIAASILFSARNLFSRSSLCAAIFFLGAAFFLNSNIVPPGHVANIATDQPRRVILKGVIADDPSVERVFYGGKKASFLVKASAVRGPGRWSGTEGLVETRVYTKTDRAFRFGDEVVLEGLISRPSSLKNPGLFDYAGYLANRGIYCILQVRDGGVKSVVTGEPANPVRRLAYRIRSAMRSSIERHLDGPDADLMKAILIGDRSGLGEALNEDFIKTGTVHILSISGLHVGMIAFLVLSVFGLLGLPKKINLALTLVLLAVYSYVAGSGAPIIRAVVMFAVFAVGYIMERDTDLLNSLAVAAFLMLLWNPKSLFDPGFQLSFASIAGIAVFAPKIDAIILKLFPSLSGRRVRWPVRKKAADYLLRGVSVSAAAWIGTWPIIASYFNIASPVSVIANLVVIPMSFAAMVLAMAMLGASCFSGALANAIALCAGLVDRALFAANHVLSRLPLAYFRIPAPSAAYVWPYYALVLSWAAMPPELAVGPRMVRRNQVFIAILLALNVSAWTVCVKQDRDAMKVTFLDVGKGDAAFVEFPGGGNLLVDAGTGGEEGLFDAGRSVVAPFLWNAGVRRIDAILVTHPHSDHLGGAVYLLRNFKVGIVMDNGVSDGSDLYREYIRAIRENGSRHAAVGEGDRLRLPAGAEFFILSPAGGAAFPDENAGSVVGKLVFKDHSVMFSADAPGPAMEAMADSYGNFLKSDIMKVPHHGGRAGTEEEVNKFYSAVSPAVSIISAGRLARYDKRQKNAINTLNSRCYDTSIDGAITICIGPNGYTVKGFINRVFKGS